MSNKIKSQINSINSPELVEEIEAADPPRGREYKTRVTIMLDADLNTRLKARCKEEDIPTSIYIRRLIRAALAQ